MISNNPKLVYSGIKARQRMAYSKRQWWKCQLLTNWKFIFGAIYL